MIPERSERIFKEIERLRQEITRRMSLADEVILSRKPEEGKWNILQILQHLILSEKLSLAYLKKKWSFSPELLEKNVITDIRGWLLIHSMRIPFPLKAPARVDVFDDSLTIMEILNNWENVRKEMYDFLIHLDDEVYNKIFYKHPSVGRVTLLHMLMFFRQHIKRHSRQIDKILDHRI